MFNKGFSTGFEKSDLSAPSMLAVEEYNNVYEYSGCYGVLQDDGSNETLSLTEADTLDIVVDNSFLSYEAKDFRIKNSSPTINSGRPTDLNPDKTRKDLGCYWQEGRWDKDIPEISSLVKSDDIQKNFKKLSAYQNSGTDSFNSTSGVQVDLGSDFEESVFDGLSLQEMGEYKSSYIVLVTPLNSQSDVGNIVIQYGKVADGTEAQRYFTVYNTGTSTGEFMWMIKPLYKLPRYQLETGEF